MNPRATFLLVPVLLVAVLEAAAAAGPTSSPARAPRKPVAAKEQPMAIQLKSSAFEPGGEIPRIHTCDGKGVPPPLSWSGVPAGTKSLALVVDDPDAPDPAAPKVVWVHWVLYNLPADAHALGEGTTSRTLPAGAREGLNDWKQTGWRGPCPPTGRHRYFFKLYALDTVLPDLERPTRAALEKAMSGHVLAQAELVGHYRRPG